MALTVVSQASLALAAAFVAYGLWKLVRIVLHRLFDPIRILPGPPSDSLIWGNLKSIFVAPSSALHEQWAEQYGDTFVYPMFMNRLHLYTHDPRALNHILNHSMVYQKTEIARFNLSRLLGNGLLTAEGEQHRQQRRIMNPAFGPAQIRELTEIFLEKSNILRDAWLAQVADSPSSAARVNVVEGLSKMTLDVIGLAGFNYAFNALGQGQPSELYAAFKANFSTVARGTFPAFYIAQLLFPLLRKIPTKVSRALEAGLGRMKEIGMALVKERKQALLAAEKGKETDHIRGRDLLTLLIKANMAIDIPENQRMSDEEVLAQVPTFLVAGHETTSTSTTWCLFALSQALAVQQRLREELLSVPTETPSMDELQALPYLDAVVRETMRVYATVPSTMRTAVADDVIPLATPVVDRRGVSHDSIHFKKGAMILVPILALNLSKKLWGADAHEFRPERWLEGVPEATTHIPGVWGNTLTFLGGAHACIGYRFAIVEMKCLLFVLLRAFEFELAVAPDEIEKKSGLVTRPVLKSNRELGSHMPMLIKPYVPA